MADEDRNLYDEALRRQEERFSKYISRSLVKFGIISLIGFFFQMLLLLWFYWYIGFLDEFTK